MKFEHALGHLVFEKSKATMHEGVRGEKKSKKFATTKSNVSNTETHPARVLITTGPLDVEDDN